jgi:transcriptional regulator of arginine metabolism
VLSSIKRMMPAGPNLIVIHTHTGAANSVGVAIDGWRDSDLVGSVAGDDTIFLAVPSRAAQDRLMRKLKQLAERSG